ncbi:hypothetical protein ACNKHV_24420 [Shigella flexneri]
MWDVADAADVFSQTLLAIPMYCRLKWVSSSHAFTLVREKWEEENDAEAKAKKLKNKFNRPSGRL